MFLYLPRSNLIPARHVSAKSTRFCLFLLSARHYKLTSLSLTLPSLLSISPLPSHIYTSHLLRNTDHSVQKTTPKPIPSNTGMDFRMLRVCPSKNYECYECWGFLVLIETSVGVYLLYSMSLWCYFLMVEVLFRMSSQGKREER